MSIKMNKPGRVKDNYKFNQIANEAINNYYLQFAETNHKNTNLSKSRQTNHRFNKNIYIYFLKITQRLFYVTLIYFYFSLKISNKNKVKHPNNEVPGIGDFTLIKAEFAISVKSSD